MLDSFFNLLFGWAMDISPVLGLIIITLVASLIVTLSYKYLTDQKKMKELKDSMKQMQTDVKNYKEDPSKMMEYNKEIMGKNLEYFKQGWKPMVFTLIPFLIMFGWLRTAYEGIDLNFLGLLHNWFWVYFIFSIIFTTILRKLMKVY